MNLIVSDVLLILTAFAGVVLQGSANRPPPPAASPRGSGEVGIPEHGSSTPYIMRSPERIKKEGNHLTGERSAYLGQHAHNPIDWYPWGKEALERAKEEGKPIFLSIGYSSCHWCHVMEEEVFEKEDVAAFMNANYISIKVDREERPDLDAVYMEAVQAMTGRGGWPMSVFLTPDLKPFYGGTYFPHETFLTIVKKLHQVFTTDRKSLEGAAHEIYEKLSEVQVLTPGAPPIDSDLIEAAARQGVAQFDKTWGGTRSQQKFPTPVRWEFMLHHYRKTGDPSYEQIVRLTLDQMGSGGIHDHVGGGFHRYTVEQTWLVPHFEKMLYDNAQIASLYIEAAKVWDQPRYEEIARDTLDFLIRDMSGQEGAFYSSYDADSGGEEGSYYIWSLEEITAVAGPADGPVLAMLLGVTREGNFEGRNIATRRISPAVAATNFDRPEAEVAQLFDRYQPALLDFRAQRTGPALDKKIITSWNGLTIAALARAYSAFKHEGYLAAAKKAAHFLWTVHRQDDGRLLRSSNHGQAANQGIIDDYAFFSLGLLELYQATGDSEFLAQGLEVIDYACDHFAHPKGGFYLTAEGHETPMGRHVPIFDSVLPSGNAGMLQALIRASALTGKPAYRDQVDTVLSAYGGMLRRAGLDMAGWLDGAEKHLGPYYEVVVAGDPSDKRTTRLKEVFYGLSPCHAVLNLLPAGGADEHLRDLMPAAKGKRSLADQPTAFICQTGSCKPPTPDPEEMHQQIMSGWKK